MNRLYSAEPDGYCGDEDNGQTSAWYVFSALGFYPVCPGADEYAVGAPYFKKAVVHLENGNDVVIKADDNCSETPYVKGFKVNGKQVQPKFLKYESIKEGGLLDFRMSDSPQI